MGSAKAIHTAIELALERVSLPKEAVQIVPTADRAAVGRMLAGLEGNIDLIIPRGGKSLVARVQKDARVPVLAHLEGNCHVYVDKGADLQKAIDVVLNSKMRRVSVCGAAETLLIDAAGAGRLLRPLVLALIDAGCEVRGDRIVQTVDPRVEAADEDDWYTEYLDAIMAVKVVEGVDAAIAHIAKYGSAHTESIVTEDKAAAETFLREVDSAIVLHNASTQFADGAEFGLGAEIGIATGRLHARGPVGARELTTYKYVVRGNGQTRP
jgi:glutamate-5-semialdehyde dehydrogenase